MDWSVLFQWTSTIGGLAGLFVLLYLLPLNRKKLKSEIRLNDTQSAKSSVEMLKDDIVRLKKDYEEKFKEFQDRITRLEEKNNFLERVNSLFRVAAENLGFWEKIRDEIERIKG